MKFLMIFMGIGILPLVFISWQVLMAFQRLRKESSENKGFAMRKSSISPTEWKRWNNEFLRWRFFRVVFWLGLGEGLLLALALQQASKIPILLPLIILCQLLPFGIVYLLHLWLLFRYGRFNLQRFDPSQNATRQLAILLMVLAAWTPIAITWGFLRVVG